MKIDSKGEYIEKVIYFLATHGLISVSLGGQKPWISNFYYVVDENFNFYFITNKNSYFSKNVQRGQEIAFSISWFDENNHLNRKGVQGVGRIEETNENDKKFVLKRFYEKFDDIAEIVFEKMLKGKMDDFIFWKIKAEFIKYLDDEEFKDFESIALKFKD